MKERLISFYTKAILIIIFGISYGIFYIKTGIGIPCLFHRITGLFCPGCGITRMMTYLMQGKLKEARMSNPGLFLCLPAILFLLSTSAFTYIKTGKSKLRTWEIICAWMIIAVLLIYTVIRNLSF